MNKYQVLNIATNEQPYLLSTCQLQLASCQFSSQLFYTRSGNFLFIYYLTNVYTDNRSQY